MGGEISRRPVLGAMAGVFVAVMLDGLPAGAATTTTPSPGGAIPEEALRRIAEQFNGTYTGKWVDSTGARGGGTGTVRIDPTTKQVKGTLAVDGKALGRTPLGRRSFSLDLSRYGHDADSLSVRSTPWGSVAWTRVAGGAQLSLSRVPGLAPGTAVDLLGRFTHPGYASFTYTITPASGTAVRGAVNAGKHGTAVPEPVVPVAGAVSPDDLASGKYACSLVTKAEATQAFGEPAKAPVNNGGRIGYGPGIDTSNCNIDTVSGNQLLQMTVFHGHSVDAAAQHFELNRAIGTPVPGLESRAYSFLSGRNIWLLRGNDVIQLEVLDQRSSDLPPALAAFAQRLASKTG